MKVAVISDIHGNSDALEAVLSAAKNDGAKKLLVLGDLVGYYYHPDKVLKLLKDWEYYLIRGNHENYLAGIANGSIKEEDIRKRYGSGHRFALEKLTKDEIERITRAPEKMNVNIGGTKFLMCHGSPWNADQYIYPDAKEEMFEKCDSVDAEFVLIGHSHYQFLHHNKHSILINAGSVGQSRKKGGEANWVLIDTETKKCQLKATPYDTSKLEKEVEITDPQNPYLRDILKRGRNA